MNDTKIPEPWLLFVRTVWLALVILILAIFFAGIPAYFNEIRIPCTVAECSLTALTPHEATILQEFGLSLDSYAGYIVGLDIYAVVILIPLVGLIFWRRSGTWLGLLLSLALVIFATFSALSAGALARQYAILRWPLFLMDFLTSILFFLLFFMFPNGRFVPRWTGVITIGLVSVFLIDLLLLRSGPVTPAYSTVSEILWLVGLIAGVTAQIYRYRRVSTPTERQQTKWIMFGLIIVFISATTYTLLLELFPRQSGSTSLVIKLGFGIAVLLFTIFPVSVLFSILRYRLWDIDILINRTLVYGLLTGVLALLYFGGVVLFQSLFSTLSEQGSQLAIVISTLVIAILFSPLRRRIQSIIDRRFYRHRYNAGKTLEAFSAVARDEVDLEILATELMYVVEKTLQPTTTYLWLAPTQYRAGESFTSRYGTANDIPES